MSEHIDYSKVAEEALKLLRPIIARLSGLRIAVRSSFQGQSADELWQILLKHWANTGKAEAVLEALSQRWEPEIYSSFERDIEQAFHESDSLLHEVLPLVERQAIYRLGYDAQGEAPGKKYERITASAAREKYNEVTIYYGTNRARNDETNPRKFYNKRRGQLEVGKLNVSIPFNHQVGQMEKPRWFRLEFTANPMAHITVLNLLPMSNSEFSHDVSQAFDLTNEKSILLYVHGYNTSFNEVAQRAAQIAFDLRFPGIPMMFSWPSVGGLIPYDADQEAAESAASDFATFLEQVVLPSGATTIHLIAHSMGNRTLTTGLRMLAGHKPTCLFNQVILTAPDLDAQIFERQIIPAIKGSAKRISMYASSRDRALLLSKKLHDYPRAGLGGQDLVVVNGLDSIDASAINTDFLGHNVMSETPLVDDLFHLVCNEMPPDQRRLIKKEKYSLPYWELPHQ